MMNLKILEDLEYSLSVQHSLFSDSVSPAEQEDELITYSLWTVFVEQPIALRGSAKNIL